MRDYTSIALAAFLAATPAALAAQDFGNDLKSRQGQFRIMSLNLGVLGAMAKGEAPYDAEAAATAAQNLVTISTLAQNHWPEGSDVGSIEGTRALPAIWENTGDFNEKWLAFGSSAGDLAAVAGDGQAGLGPAIGAVGKTCQSCHEDYRESTD